MHIEVEQTFSIAYGHRLMGHEGKCAHYHGHTGHVALTVIGQGSLDNVGRVVDFAVIRDKVGKWLNDTFDHAMVLHADDPLVPTLAWPELPYHLASKNLARAMPHYNGAPYVALHEPSLAERPAPGRVTVMRVNPSSENLAALILAHASDVLSASRVRPLLVTRVKFYESEKSAAVAVCAPERIAAFLAEGSNG